MEVTGPEIVLLHLKHSRPVKSARWTEAKARCTACRQFAITYASLISADGQIKISSFKFV